MHEPFLYVMSGWGEKFELLSLALMIGCALVYTELNNRKKRHKILKHQTSKIGFAQVGLNEFKGRAWPCESDWDRCLSPDLGDGAAYYRLILEKMPHFGEDWEPIGEFEIGSEFLVLEESGAVKVSLKDRDLIENYFSKKIRKISQLSELEKSRLKKILSYGNIQHPDFKSGFFGNESYLRIVEEKISIGHPVFLLGEFSLVLTPTEKIKVDSNTSLKFKEIFPKTNVLELKVRGNMTSKNSPLMISDYTEEDLADNLYNKVGLIKLLLGVALLLALLWWLYDAYQTDKWFS